jgi:hypothetical protein
MPTTSRLLESYRESIKAKILVDRSDTLLPDVDLEAGGQWFVDAVTKYGINEKGEQLRLSKPFLEAALLIGDFRIQAVSTSGGAQIFKTLIHLQLVSALITIGKKDFAWVYPQASLIPKLVPTGFKPVVGSWESAFKLERKAKSTDSKSMALHQSTYGTARFISATGTAGKKLLDGTAAANTNVVAFSSDLAIYEERSQYLQKEVDVIRRRFLQGRIPSYPERLIGTPGNGGGIELEISQADYSFISTCVCNKCEKVTTLSPIGALFVSIGKDEVGNDIYFDSAGRPLDWWYTDEADKIGTAYYGCEHCGAPISQQQRMESSFKCVKTGIYLADFLNSIPYGYPNDRISCGITLTPLIRDSNSSTASSIVANGLQTTNTQDWQQQELGIPTSSSGGGITLAAIRKSIGADIPLGQPDYTFFGLDQGRSEHWVVIIKYRIPQGITEPVLKYEKAHREVFFAKAVSSLEVDRVCSISGGGALDNEPDRSWAQKIINTHKGTILFDQVASRTLNGKLTKELIVQSGGEDIPAIAIDTHRFQDYILTFFNSTFTVNDTLVIPQVSLPSSVDINDLSNKSLTRHLSSSVRDPERGIWTRPEDKTDDLLKAFVGAELRFYLQVFGGLPNHNQAGIMDLELDALTELL